MWATRSGQSYGAVGELLIRGPGVVIKGVIVFVDDRVANVGLVGALLVGTFGTPRSRHMDNTYRWLSNLRPYYNTARNSWGT